MFIKSLTWLAQVPPSVYRPARPILVDPGPVFLIGVASIAALTSGFAFQQTLLLLLKQPVAERDFKKLLFPYTALLFAACIGIGSVPLVISIPGTFSYPLAFMIGTSTAVAIWFRFVAEVLKMPPERFFKQGRTR